MVGDSIDLECQVDFTSQPVGNITWRINGKVQETSGNLIMEILNDDVFLEDHFKMHIIED